MAYEVANKMRIQRTYENTRLVPMKSSFKDIYGTLTSEGVEADSLSGIIIGNNTTRFLKNCARATIYVWVLFIEKTT